ncbi:MAG: sulfite exporter TauE/SafE family protein [Myxococcota bacterium]
MFALAIALSLLIGVSLGLLGGGGSILTTPILIYALGVEPKAAIASSLLVVGVTSAAAVVQHARAGNVEWRTGLVFGAAGMAGAYVGGRLAALIPASVLLLLFAGMMVATSIAMFRGRGDASPATRSAVWRMLLDGFVVGVVTGLVGAGGGFLVVPALALLGGLPMRKAVGTSLAVIAMKSFAGFAGHAGHVTVDFALVGVVSAAAVAGSVLGGLVSQRVPAEGLRRGFAVFVLVMAGFVLWQQVPKVLPEVQVES